MTVIDKTFKFPIVMIDMNRERDRKNYAETLNMDVSPDPEWLESEAACPVDDYVGHVKKWLPTAKSYEKAIDGEFEACLVTFNIMGTFLCTWPSEVFIEKLSERIKEVSLEESKHEMKIVNIDVEDVVKLLIEGGYIDDIQEEENGDK